SAVSVKTGEVIAAWQVGDNVHGLDIGDDGKNLFVSSKQGDKLTALDAETGKVANETTLVPAPYHLNTIHGTGKVYVSSRKEPKIWVVDQNTLKVVREIVLPAGEGHQMAIVQ
ncbi:MAG TPA: YncE family protein, partial [Gammaproteobacteria bacterium]|nr:YncE family protein [Gammaproteobacteria bacterium]